jgi:hypothetical protein
MHIQHGIRWHAAQAACARAYRFGLCAAEQAAARPGSGRRPTPRTLHAHARGMPCCMHIGHGMKNDACMIRMRLGDCRGSPASFSENRQNRRFSESGAESPDACHDARNESICIIEHARAMVHATGRMRAHAACHPTRRRVPEAACLPTRKFGGMTTRRPRRRSICTCTNIRLSMHPTQPAPDPQMLNAKCLQRTRAKEEPKPPNAAKQRHDRDDNT